MLSTLFSALTLLGVLPLATAKTTAECCNLLRQEYEADVHTYTSPAYDYENHNFWSATEFLNPGCIFSPDASEKVSRAVALFTENECKFSIKGGGHSAIPGAASIHDGILMPMEKINSTSINFEEGYIRVGAGTLLGDVYRALDPHKLSAVIGRYEKIGMGLTVGAGFSYFSNRDGLAVDNVLNYEVVLANGTIVNANKSSHPDLFWALKGGSNNFGVVTYTDLATVETPGRVFGGIVYYPEESLKQVGDVIYDYHVRQAVNDKLTHALPQYGFDGQTNKTISFTPVLYNDDVEQLPDIMQAWNNTPHYRSTLHNRNYSSLAFELNDGFPDGQFQEQRILTVYADRQLYRDVWWKFREWTQRYRHIPGFYGLHCNMPITPRQIQQGIAKGGNALGLEGAKDSVLAILYFGITFSNQTDADHLLPAHDEFVQGIQELAAKRGLLHPYLMLTYSGWNQPVLESYGEENLARMRAVQAAYDPGHVFQRLVPGGQKLPPANAHSARNGTGAERD